MKRVGLKDAQVLDDSGAVVRQEEWEGEMIQKWTLTGMTDGFEEYLSRHCGPFPGLKHGRSHNRELLMLLAYDRIPFVVSLLHYFSRR
jgi:hypothetical protein